MTQPNAPVGNTPSEAPQTGNEALPEASESQAAPGPTAKTYRLIFTGSGSEYFRIWVVNLLLVLITLGLYYPWAQVRKRQYMLGNTWLDQHAFEFDAKPRRMLRGTLLVGALLGAYFYANQSNPWSGTVALLILVLVWPAVWLNAKKFRLFHTRWRGLRFGFDASTAQMYGALWPAIVLYIVFVSALALLADPEIPRQWPAALGFILIGVLLLLLLAGPYAWWRWQHFAQSSYVLASLRSQLVLNPRMAYRLVGKTAVVLVLTGLIMVLLLWVAMSLASIFGGMAQSLSSSAWGRTVLVYSLVAVGALAVWSSQAAMYAYWTSRTQNLLWNNTHCQGLTFRSRLRARHYAQLLVKNLFLTALTLGLYWPFAVIAMRKLRTRTVRVQTSLALQSLFGQATASGDAAAAGGADMGGLDLGL
jgi:uncharacterized membrane protein YjgN (DUF898 family)